jgi:phosphoribosylaminoimidazole-succinocarboxamide synthase
VIQTLYRGSVKDLLGPVQAVHSHAKANAVIFEYTDAFSVFDWGRMPDLLARKGEALAILAADFFERVEKPEIWKEFSRSSEALALRKGNRFGAIFNELGEELQTHGLRTHYLGILESSPQGAEVQPRLSSNGAVPFRRLVVQQVSVVKPTLANVLGRSLPDYYSTRISPAPRLVPLEVVFRFGCPEGSSLLDRVSRDPSYLASLGFPDAKAGPSVKWDFPVLELFTKLETSDRPVSLSEALAISGLSAGQLQEVLLKTAWVAGLLKFWCARRGLELSDGKLEWAISGEGRSFLVDAVGPDELRISKNGVQLSKEFLRSYYRKTSWYQALEKAKTQAKSQGISEWKRLVLDHPAVLPPAYRELASQVYLALTHELTGKKWFPEAWSLQKVVDELQKLDHGSSG